MHVIFTKSVNFILLFHYMFALNLGTFACECKPDQNGNYVLPEKQVIDDSLVAKWGEDVDISSLRKGDILLVKVGSQWQFAELCSSSEFCFFRVHVVDETHLVQVSKKNIKKPVPFLSQLYRGVPSADEMVCLIQEIKKFLPNPQEDQSGAIQTVIISPESSVVATGDLHGDITSLRTNLHMQYHKKLLNDETSYPIYLGDYADRGLFGVELWATLLNLKAKNPNLSLLRGNHESGLARSYGFFGQVVDKYIRSDDVIEEFERLFRCLPQALLVGSYSPKDKNNYRFILFCHGGLEKRLAKNMNSIMIEAIKMHMLNQTKKNPVTHYFSLSGDSGLMWSDPYSDRLKGLSGKGKAPSARGAKSVYDYDKSFIENYLKTSLSSKDSSEYSYCLDGIVRGHGHIPGGIVRLRDKRENDEDWEKLESGKAYTIEPGSVYSCTSSVLPDSDCYEAAFSVLKFDESGKWTLTPHIQSLEKNKK